MSKFTCPLLMLLVVGGPCAATDDPKPNISAEAQKEIDRLNEEKAIAEAQAAANDAKNKALFGNVDKPIALSGTLSIQKGDSGISEWATYSALNVALESAKKRISTAKCPKITPVPWTAVSASRARIARISSSSNSAAKQLSGELTGNARNFAKLTSFPATVMTATQWIAQMAGYFRSDLSTTWGTATITPETAKTAFVAKLLEGNTPPMIAVPYPSDQDFIDARKYIAPMIAELDKIIAAAKASSDTSLVDQSIDLEANKDDLLRKIAEDRAASRLSEESYCMLDVKVSSAISATTTSRNLFRTAKSYDRGSVSLTWELVSRGGRVESAGQISAICEADTKLTRSTQDIKPKCKAFSDDQGNEND